MYYQMGNFVPWREAAWALLAERLALTPARRAAARFRPGQVSAPSARNSQDAPVRADTS